MTTLTIDDCCKRTRSCAAGWRRPRRPSARCAPARWTPSSSRPSGSRSTPWRRPTSPTGCWSSRCPTPRRPSPPTARSSTATAASPTAPAAARLAARPADPRLRRPGQPRDARSPAARRQAVEVQDTVTLLRGRRHAGLGLPRRQRPARRRAGPVPDGHRPDRAAALRGAAAHPGGPARERGERLPRASWIRHAEADRLLYPIGRPRGAFRLGSCNRHGQTTFNCWPASRRCGRTRCASCRLVHPRRRRPGRGVSCRARLCHAGRGEWRLPECESGSCTQRGRPATRWHHPPRFRLAATAARQLTYCHAAAINPSTSPSGKRAEQALRDADRRKDEFLATLAHELRNPLAPIRNAVQILKAKGPPTAGAAMGPGRDRPPGAGHGPAARRPARRVPHLPQQAGTPQGAGRSGRRGGGRRGNQPPGHRGRRPRAHRHLAARADPPGGRPGAAGPGVRQPPQQRRQVHRGRRPHPAERRAAGERRGRVGQGQRHRHRRRDAAAHLRDVLAGETGAGAVAGRARHRPVAGQGAGRAARREHRGPQRRAGPGERVRRPPAGRRGDAGPGTGPAGRGRRATARDEAAAS